MADEPAGRGDAIRVLVFGQSNATGEHLADKSAAWPKLLGRELSARIGRPVAVDVRPIYVHNAAVERYLERELEKYQPDVVIMGTSAFAFAQRMVSNRIRRRWGDRPANWYLKLERRVDDGTRHSNTGSKANRLARRVLMRVVGAEPTATYDAVIEGTSTVLRRLARQEGTTTAVLLQMNPILDGMKDPGTNALLARFDTEVRALAAQLHFPPIECRPALEAVPDQKALLFPDRLHYTAYGHRVIGDEVMRAFSDGRVPLPGI